MEKYFSYFGVPGCGIQEITLLGTEEDWIKLKDKVQKLREYDCDFWIDQLEPVIEQFY